MEAQSSPAPKPTPAPFPEIPGYRIEAVIGRGSTGIVYRATQLAVERKVALKVLHPELTGRVRAVRRLQREARTAAKLGHPGLVTAIDMGNAGGRWWYAMELVEGPSLAERLKQSGPLSERDALKLFVPLCEALEHAFEHGVVHRDIKPGNILIDASGRARIVDLGLAFTEEDPALTLPGGTLGTPHYIAPEQARNPKSADVKSDIWSLGATLFHAVCGRPPFAGESVAEILSGVLYARIPDPGTLAPDLSKGLRLVLRKCLSRDPERRYQNPRELREDLERIVERRQVLVKRAALDPVQGELARRRRMTIGAAAAVTLLIVVAAALWARWRRDSAGESGLPLAPYEPLERIAVDVRGAKVRLATALTQLEALRDEVPFEHEPRLREVIAEARRRYGEAVSETRAAFQLELSRRAKERDLVGALALIEAGLEPTLRTELNPSPAQLAQILAEWKVAERRRELLGEIDSTLASLEREARALYDARYVALANAREAAHEWRSAREALRASAADVMARCSVPAHGLPPERVAALVAELEQTAILGSISELEGRWRAYDARLAGEVLARADELAVAVDERQIDRASDALRTAWRELCQRERLRDDERLSDVSDGAHAAVEQRCADLAQREEGAKLEDARELLDGWRERLAPSWTRRRYAELAAEWARAAELDYLEPLRREIELEQREAELLEALLVRAAEGVRAVAAKGEPTLVQVGSIQRAGRVDPGIDPLGQGFRLLPTDAAAGAPPLALALREVEGLPNATVLGTSGVLAFAALAPATDPRDGVVLALFTSREGDWKAARQLLPLQAPAEPDLLDLASIATARIQSADEQQGLRLEQRTDEARRLLQIVNRVGLARGVDARTEIERIHKLLTEYGDIELVRAVSDDLRARRAELAAPPRAPTRQDFADLFGPDQVEVSGSKVSMRFRFDGAAQGAWKSGAWSFAGEGWQAREPSTREELFDESRWPRLVLRAPIALEGALDVEIDFEQPKDSGPPQLLALSVAGVHVAFLGASPETGKAGLFLIESGGPERFRAAVEDLLARRRGTEFAGLVRGAKHTVKVELSQGRGSVVVFLDGKKLDQQAPRRPGPGEIGDESLVVRALERISLREVRFEGRTR